MRHLRHLTLKYFEIFCADTIPLLMLDHDHAEAVYGPAGRELVLSGNVAEKLLDALQRPDHYRDVVEDVRRHLIAHYSYDRRVEELVAALQTEAARKRSRAMKLVFVYWGYENAGSMLDLRGYARAAQGHGARVALYGPPDPNFALDYSQDSTTPTPWSSCSSGPQRCNTATGWTGRA